MCCRRTNTEVRTRALGSKQPAALLFHPCGRGAADRTHRCLKRNLGAQLRRIFEAKATAGCVQGDLWVVPRASALGGVEGWGGGSSQVHFVLAKEKKNGDLVRDPESGRQARWIGSPPLSAAPSASKLSQLISGEVQAAARCPQ